MKSLRQNRALYVMIALPAVYFLIFHYWPMYGVQIAFKDFSPAYGIVHSPWAGLEHFERFFNSYYFRTVLFNTFGISLYTIIVGIPLPVILAVMFSELRSNRLRGFLQTVSYAPNFISIVIAASILMFFMRPESGVINAVREHLGLSSVDYLGQARNFWHIIVWSDMWQFAGWSSLIYTAAIAGISSDQYEASYMDGANKLQRIWHVTLPNLRPTIVIITVLSIGNVMSVGFEKILLLQNALNADRSEVIMTYVYKSGIQQAQYSFAAAIGLFNNAINFIVLLGANLLARRSSGTSLW